MEKASVDTCTTDGSFKLKREFVGYPKLSFIEADKFFDRFASHDPNFSDLNFTWEEEINLKIINDDYLGPNSYRIVEFFHEGLGKKTLNHHVEKKVFSVFNPLISSWHS